MTTRFRSLLSLALLLLPPFAPGFARAQSTAGAPADEAAAQAPPTVDAACTLTPGGIMTASFIWTPPEALTSFAWKIPASSCTTCQSDGALDVNSVTIRMRWLFACSAQAEVSIVRGVQGATCLVPDPTNVVCGPASYTITGTGNATAFHTLPLPEGCCVSGDAFVMLRFTGLGPCASASTSPGLAASTSTCTSCTQFVTASGIFPTTTEWCSIGASRMTWLSIDADCCSATPAPEGSWGRIKARYR